MSHTRERAVDTSKGLAHFGLGLVTYVPLALYVLFVLIAQPEAVGEVFTSGIPAFLGYLATTMTMFGWPLVIAAMVISLRGLVKQKFVVLNAVSLGCCAVWFAAGYSVIHHFR